MDKQKFTGLSSCYLLIPHYLFIILFLVKICFPAGGFICPLVDFIFIQQNIFFSRILLTWPELL